VKGRRALLLVVPAAVAAAAAGIYCAVATPRYEARAYVLVSPVARDDPAFAGIPVVRASDDPQAAARTIARLVPTEEVAEAVRLQLGSELSRSALLAAVSAHAHDGTVAFEGRASSAPRAAQIANAFATELVAQRTARFQADRAAAVGQLRRQLASGARSEPERKAIARRLALLDGLAGSSDPTVRVASAAAAPAHASWPRPWLLVPVALAAGAAIGLALLVVARRRRYAGLRRREELVRRREEAVARAEHELARRAAKRAAAPPEPAPDATGEWKIDDLERFVEAQRGTGAHRVAEWEAYVFHLRKYADAEGRLPPEFDALVEEAFRDLVANDASLKASAVEADQVP
jgi:capsular polysaccharide biosynthesis protein